MHAASFCASLRDFTLPAVLGRAATANETLRLLRASAPLTGPCACRSHRSCRMLRLSVTIKSIDVLATPERHKTHTAKSPHRRQIEEGHTHTNTQHNHTATCNTLQIIADEYYRTRDVLKTLGPAGAQYEGVTIRPAKVCAVLRDWLTKRKRCVEIYEEAGGAWRVTRRYLVQRHLMSFRVAPCTQCNAM
jgi:hypothetical protein